MNRRLRSRYPRWVRPVALVLAVLCFGVGVVLAILPGPAFVFFGLSGALLAAQSAWVATRLDRAEVWVRRWRHRHEGHSSGGTSDGARR